MKFSYNWLKELSGTTKTPQEVKDLLTLHSFEVEGIEELGKDLDKVVIGEVLEVKKHPDADKLNVAKVNIGEKELQIVCGAPNLKEGQKVPVALVGAVLPGNFEIKEAEIRGIKSSGMICAEDELGIGSDHEGIIVLSQDAPVSEKFADYMGLNDSILEISILPNRAHDALNYEGMAREIALLEGRIILNEDEKLESRFKADKNLKIEIETEKCPRYIGARIEKIKIEESPIWIKNRLKASGINPINNIVDITNYVMLLTGQPLHAFDAKKVTSISVRMAEKGETLKILNGEELNLRTEDMVITDEKEPIALAGVMGGLESGINNETQSIILESASFDAINIRKTKSKHRIESDAAYRYERDIDVNLTQHAIIAAIELILELAGGELVAINDNYPKKVDSWEVELKLEKVNDLLGIVIEKEKIKDILNNLGIFVTETGDNFSCKIPTRRIDLVNQEDLIEEIGRIFSYTKIETKPLKGKVQVPKKNSKRELERKLRDILIHAGMDEIKGYSFYSREDARALGLDDENHIVLMNPLSREHELIRRTLVVGILQSGKRSLSYFDSLYLFDMGKVYISSNEFLPKEELLVGGAVIEKGETGEQFFVLKGILENLFHKLGIEGVDFSTDFDEDEKDVLTLHKSRKALIKSNKGKILGVMGEITKSAHKYFGIKKIRACVFELNVEALLGEITDKKKYVQLAKFPSVNRDISMVVDKKAKALEIKNQILKSGGELLEEIVLFDNFVNSETKERSMAFHLTFASLDRTLTAQEVDEKINEIIKILESGLGVMVKKLN